MEWSAENKLAFYEKVADDESAARELRMLFARKANCIRIMARLQATRKIASGLQQAEARDRERAQLMDGEEAEALLFSSIRMAGNLRERADDACRKLLRHKPPEELMTSLKESIGQRRKARRQTPSGRV